VVLAGLLASGDLRPAVDRSYPLDEAATAIADLAAGRVRGKAVIRVATA
jgi:NADPH:quinone reductase-like Zn-dependent oxidoreductase